MRSVAPATLREVVFCVRPVCSTRMNAVPGLERTRGSPGTAGSAKSRTASARSGRSGLGTRAPPGCGVARGIPERSLAWVGGPGRGRTSRTWKRPFRDVASHSAYPNCTPRPRAFQSSRDDSSPCPPRPPERSFRDAALHSASPECSLCNLPRLGPRPAPSWQPRHPHGPAAFPRGRPFPVSGLRCSVSAAADRSQPTFASIREAAAVSSAVRIPARMCPWISWASRRSRGRNTPRGRR